MDRQHQNGLLASSIPPGGCAKGMVGGKEVAIFKVDGSYYATQNACTHQGGPLCEGALWGDTVTCPWHGSEFNVRTGKVVTDPAAEPLETYGVEVRDGVVVVAKT